MKKTFLYVSRLLLIIMFVSVLSGYVEKTSDHAFTEKGEIAYYDEILEMDYKSDEIEKIIDNTFTSLHEEVETTLEIVVETFQTYPEYKNIKIEDLEYDLNNYYISPVLTVEQLKNAESDTNKKYYHNIVIPIYLDNKNVYDFIVHYDRYSDFYKNSYCLSGHSSYRVYTERLTPENTSILDISLPKEKFEKLAKDEIGKDTEIYNQYLLLKEPDCGNHGIQEDNIYIKTNKGDYVFVSASCSFQLSELIDEKNNAFYIVEDYFSTFESELIRCGKYYKQNMFDDNTSVKKHGYIFILIALMLVIVIIFVIFWMKKKRKNNQ